MKVNLIIFIVTVLLYSCSSIKTENIKSTNKLKKYSFFYNLPKNELQININAVKQTYIPGPYKDYADKYLGIKLKYKDKKESWQITDVKINSVPVVDTSKYFVVSYSGDKYIKSYNLSELGFLISLNSDKELHKYVNTKKNIQHQNKYLPEFINSIIKPIFVEKIDTTYKTVRRDSIVRRVPVYKRNIVSKDLESRAEDAARFIIKIRKRRLRVLTGMDKNFPKGEAAKQIIKKLDELENQYLTLFVGKTINENKQFSFNIVPQKNKLDYKICNFSEDKGFSDNANSAISLKLTDESFNSVIDSFLIKNTKSKKVVNGIFYRLPKAYKAVINLDNKNLLSQTVKISQFGNLTVLNKKDLQNKSVIFDASTGAIKSLTRKNRD